MNIRGKKILVTGATGLVGRNLTPRLEALGADVYACGHTRAGEYNCDLRDAQQTANLFDKIIPDVVIHLAARVGGIYANMAHKEQFYLENTLINTNVVREISRQKTPYVLAMGTGCAYPKRLEGNELIEELYLDGIPEPTNDAYAYAKRNMLVHLTVCAEGYGLKYCFCIPANIYGPHDNFHPTYSHVVPGLIHKFMEARQKKLNQVVIWGTGRPRRDFLYIDDLVSALTRLLDSEITGPVNVATGEPVSINELVYKIKEITGYAGEIVYAPNYAGGQSTRLFATGKIKKLGWRPRYTLREGLMKTVDWYEHNK